MYCTQCGQPLSGKSAFCPWCGSPIIRDHDIDEQASSQRKKRFRNTERKNRLKRSRRRTLTILALIFLLAIVSGSTWLVIDWFRNSMIGEPHDQSLLSAAAGTSFLTGMESDDPGRVDPHSEFFSEELFTTTDHSSQRDRTDMYTGTWINNNSKNHTINVYKQDGQNISIEVTSVKLTGDGKNVSAIDVTKIEDVVLIDGCGAKNYTDSWGNEGMIYLAFANNSLQVNYEVLSRGLGRWGIDTGGGTYHKETEIY